MANAVIEALRWLGPHPTLLAVAVCADLAFGDPVYAWHPVRLTGRLLIALESRLRGLGLDGYGGGCLLFAGLSTAAISALIGLAWVVRLVPGIALAVHALLLYALLALGDLLHHVWRIESALRRGDLATGRAAVSALVGRDTVQMDGPACRRAAVESLSENLTDGFVSPVFWYVLAGLPGVVLFKVVSTMDSMVGYKTPRYLQFGWCGARLDDAMNYLPARLTWLVIAAVAAALPRFAGRKAWRIGLDQHAILLGPNSGWSEAATAGALERRIVGPIWLNGVQVTDLWVGDSNDEPLGSALDVTRAMVLVVAAAATVVVLAVSFLHYFSPWALLIRG